MKNILLILFLLCALPVAHAATVTSSTTTTQPVTVAGSAYDLSFQISWWSDDYPMFSAPGRLDLLDSSGTLVGRVVASDYDGDVSITVSGNGSVDGVQANIGRYAGGTPADGVLSGVWHVTGLSPGTYTLRLWHDRTWDTLYSATTVWTNSALVSGSEPAAVNQPPTVTLLTPGDQTVMAGTTFTITSHATDPDGNITNHNLDIQRPAGDWNFQGGFATGEPFQGGPVGNSGDSTRTASFTFTDVGTYYVRSAANDGSGWYPSATVAITVIAPPPSQYFLSTSAGTGGSVTPGDWFNAGTTATVTATPDAAYDLAGWTGDAGGAANPLAVLMDRSKTVQAVFALKNFALVTSATLGGAVTPGGTYPPGTTLTISAAPDATHRFLGWAGDAAGTAVTVAVTLDAPKIVQAVFTDKTAQTIAFPAPADQPVSGPPLPLAAAASSGLPVSYTVLSGPATVTGSLLTITGPGAVTVQASQTGDGYFLPASSITRTFNAYAATVLRYRPNGRTLLEGRATGGGAPYVIETP